MERIADLERRYVLEVLDSQFRSSAHRNMTGRLEETFARLFNCRYAIAFVNGTATLHAALAAAGVGPGDEVIVPPLTMASTTFAVLHAGALPVFADIDPHTWTISPQSIEERITPRTKAVIPVAIYGLSPDMDGIMEMAFRHGLFVLEDDAQCFLGKYKGRIVGSIGHAASFSFQTSKHVTCGEGGIVTTNNGELACAIRRFNSLGYAAVGARPGEGRISKDVIQDPDYSRHVSIGWNYRLSELCAAAALGQCERLSELVAQRVSAARRYKEAMAGCDWLIPQFVSPDTEHSYWTFAVKLARPDLDWREFRMKFMECGGGGVYSAWKLTYLEPVFQGRRISPEQTQVYGPGLCPTAETVQSRLLQFKTNYFTADAIEEASDALRKTIDYFDASHATSRVGSTSPSSERR